MLTKEEAYKLSFYFIAATTASIIRYIRQEKKSFPVYMVEMLLGASFAFFVVPAIVEYWELSLYMGTGITWILTMFSETILKKVENKLVKKIDDVSNTIT